MKQVCSKSSEEQLKCAYRRYCISCIVIVSRPEFCADIAQNIMSSMNSNAWNPKTGGITGRSIHRTLFGRRF